jgi:hypothetical protein
VSLLETILPLEKGVRLIGITMSGLDDGTKLARTSPQLDLFSDL